MTPSLAEARSASSDRIIFDSYTRRNPFRFEHPTGQFLCFSPFDFKSSPFAYRRWSKPQQRRHPHLKKGRVSFA